MRRPLLDICTSNGCFDLHFRVWIRRVFFFDVVVFFYTALLCTWVHVLNGLLKGGSRGGVATFKVQTFKSESIKTLQRLMSFCGGGAVSGLRRNSGPGSAGFCSSGSEFSGPQSESAPRSRREVRFSGSFLRLIMR